MKRILKPIKKLIRNNNYLDWIYLLARYGTYHPFSTKYWNNIWIEDNNWRSYPALFDSVISLIPRESKVLDVGCGSGFLLKRLREEKYCDVFGVDISPIAIAKCFEQGIDGKTCKMPDLPLPDNYYDVVVSTEFIEHIHNPYKSLIQMHRVCKPNGKIILTTPNNYLPPSDCDEHVNIFDESSIRLLCKPLLKEIQTHVVPYFYSGDADVILLYGQKK